MEGRAPAPPAAPRARYIAAELALDRPRPGDAGTFFQEFRRGRDFAGRAGSRLAPAVPPARALASGRRGSLCGSATAGVRRLAFVGHDDYAGVDVGVRIVRAGGAPGAAARRRASRS